MNSIWTLLIVMTVLTKSLMAQGGENTYGYVEKATIVDKELTLSAKLDTGAKSASLNATKITEFEVSGKPFIRFTVPFKGENYVFECPYVGRVKIKVRAHESSKDGVATTAPIKRPVVMLKVKLGTQTREIRVNLTNRKRFIYPLLLGRDAIIAFNGAVDPALTFTLSKSRNQHEK